MKPPPFAYVAPTTVGEVVATLSEHGDEAKLIAGGQSLVPMLALRLARPAVLVDLQRVSGLDHVSLEDGVLTIGALTRQRTIELLPGLSERCAMITDAVGMVGHVAIRNRGTVAGSLAHADPAAEWPALALVLDAEFDLVGPGGKRSLSASDFFVTYLTTAIKADELLMQIRLPLPGGICGSCFTEIARRHGDFAIAGVGALLSMTGGGSIADARIGLIGVGDRAVRATLAEEALRGEHPDAALFAHASELVSTEIEPLDDIHASSAERRHLARVLTSRALTTAIQRTQRGGLNGGT
jgi:aerobic carbon-monoxide dehydrogenase medium subunit